MSGAGELFVVLAAGVVALQIAMSFLRRAAADERPYLMMCALDLAALIALRVTGREETLEAVVAVAVAAVLTVGTRILERLEANAVAGDRLRSARRLAVVRELVVPGRGAARHRRAIENLIELRERGSQALARRMHDELSRARDAAEAVELHEELLALLVLDRRFAEAVEHFERHLGVGHLERRPSLLPQLSRAYAELGRFERAAEIIDAVERSAPPDPSLTALLARARLVLLACAGAVAPLGRVLVDGAEAWLHPREREILIELARERAKTTVVDEALAASIASRVEAGPRVRTQRATPITIALIALNVSAFIASNLLAGHDEVGLIRAGALFRPAVLGGEWWRAIAAMFLHAGPLHAPIHLAVNMYGLYLLGRFAEELCGAPRYFVIYLAGGIGGAVASSLAGVGALSVGASGAIMGLLGALIVILFLQKRRGRFPEAWRRVLLWNLILLGALQIYIGFQFPMIDNAAHVGGMLGGAVAALVFAPGLLLGDGRFARALVLAIAVLGLALTIVAGVQVARTPLSATLARLPVEKVRVGAVELSVPKHWQLDEARSRFEDPYLDLEITVGPRGEISSSHDDEPEYQALLERVRRSARTLP